MSSEAYPISNGGATIVSALEPYIPPNVPHGFPHVIRFATLSSMDLPLEVRFLASGWHFSSRRLPNPLPARKNSIAPSSPGTFQHPPPTVTHGPAA